MFFIELRQKFIARELAWENGEYKLKGYYFKTAQFKPNDLLSITEYLTDTRFGRDIVTALSWTPGKPNYKILLKDGRVFYLPGHMEEMEQLRSRLEADIEKSQ